MTAPQLKEILDAVREQEDLRPQVDEEGHVLRTFCNIGLDRILGLCGIPRLINKVSMQPLCANDMCDYMRNSYTRWTKVTGEVACARASQGILVVACQKGNIHGHLCCIYPAPMQHSGSWGKDVPMASNIGKENGILRVSQCFKTEPDYYSIKI